MKITIGALFILLTLLLNTVSAKEKSEREKQLELIGYYQLIMHGRDNVSAEALSQMDFSEDMLPLKCGTPTVAAFAMGFDQFDKELISRHSLTLFDRPTETDETYDSPGGIFKVHFTRSGSHAVYQPNITTDGIPNYVVGVARIFDSVYTHIIITLGYPLPPSDGGYAQGVDSLYDVYITNLGGAVFGLTYPDSLQFDGIGSLRGTSFIELDNDYQESSFSTYNSRPLDAVRVTAAHEYFHAVHFGIDFTEMEDWNSPTQRRYWYEMSATWMEEEIYDDINDYYSVLPFFFRRPRESIQQFNGPADFHPYGSCVFPIFLTEKYGVDIIKSIWLKCGSMGVGPNFLVATQIAIDSASGGTENFRSAFGEFALWNFFTGSRAASAPAGVGYSERAFYPEIPETSFTIVSSYPASLLGNINPKSPVPNSAAYLKLENMRAIDYTADSNFRIFVSLGDGIDSSLPQGWAVGTALQSDTISSEYTSTLSFANDDAVVFIQFPQPRQYRSVTLILAPASWRREPYSSTAWETGFGYFTNELLVDSLIDTLVLISCCEGIRGDLNGDGQEATILDLTFLIDDIFRGGPASNCKEEADLNGDGTSSNILDLTFLIDSIFRGGPPPGPC
ncbi:MAG: hypothetical protein IH931_00085 [candidate division Zixibacteria bacterium]|nr:hypothetical protein [candidate division Zixibacteria bacterium]